MDGMGSLILTAYKTEIRCGFSLIENADFLNPREKSILLMYYRDGKSRKEIVIFLTYQKSLD